MYTCRCGVPVHPFIGRDQKLKFRCAQSKCKVFACSFLRPDGYDRPPLPRPEKAGSTSQEDHGVFFEACLLPKSADDGGMAAAAGGDLGVLARTRSKSAIVLSVLLDPTFKGVRVLPDEPGGVFVCRVPLQFKGPLMAALCALVHPVVQVYDIPKFFCKCFETLEAQYQTQHEAATSSRRSGCSRPAAADSGTSLPPAVGDDGVAAPSLLSSGCFDEGAHDDALLAKLKPYQRRGVEFLLEHGGRGMIADEMGLGKTVQAIAAAHLYRSEWPLLIVCPVSLMENWAREVVHWLGIPRSRIACLNGKARADLSVHSVVMVAYSSLSCVANDPPYRVVVMDESHFVKTPDAKRSQAAIHLAAAATRVMLLSGTPSMSRPGELYTQLAMLHPKEMPTKSQFEARYCNAYFDDFGYQNGGNAHLAELYVLLKHFVIRRQKKDVLKELPNKTRSILYVCITAKEKKLLEGTVKALKVSIDKSGGSGLGSAARGPNAFELKIATARAKAPAVKDYLKDLLEGTILPNEEKVIVFAHHQCMMEAIAASVQDVRPRNPVDFIMISGDTSIAERERLADHFRTDPKCHVAILSMQACGTGHNFTCASMVVFSELDWNPSTHLQCEDRVHRIGQSNACTIRYLLAEDTSDALVWPLLQEKMSVTTALLDNAARHDPSGAHLAPRDGVREDVKRTDVPAERKQQTLERFFQTKPPTSQQTATAVASPQMSPSVPHDAGAASPAVGSQTSVRRRGSGSQRSTSPLVKDAAVVVDVDADDTTVPQPTNCFGRPQASTTTTCPNTTPVGHASAERSVDIGGPATVDDDKHRPGATVPAPSPVSRTLLPAVQTPSTTTTPPAAAPTATVVRTLLTLKRNVGVPRSTEAGGPCSGATETRAIKRPREGDDVESEVYRID